MVLADAPLKLVPEVDPDPLLLKVIALVVLALIVISEVPEKLMPLIFRAVSNAVAVAALPDVFWFSMGRSDATMDLNIGLPLARLGAA